MDLYASGNRIHFLPTTSSVIPVPNAIPFIYVELRNVMCNMSRIYIMAPGPEGVPSEMLKLIANYFPYFLYTCTMHLQQMEEAERVLIDKKKEPLFVSHCPHLNVYNAG